MKKPRGQVRVPGAFGVHLRPQRTQPAEDEGDATLRMLADHLAAHYSYDEIQELAANVRHELHRRAEIEAMFARLSRMPPWTMYEEVVWRRQLIWADYGKYWRTTPEGRAYDRKFRKEWHERLRSEVVEVVPCKGCRKPFARTAYDVMRKRGLVCSTACKGRSRGNIKLITIGNESLPLKTWAARHGLKFATVYQRVVMLGWDLEKALRTPAANRGQKPHAAAAE